MTRISASTGAHDGIIPFIGFPGPAVSALTIADRLITLAQDADRAGYPETATTLVSLVYSVLDASH